MRTALARWLAVIALAFTGCASHRSYHDTDMDFSTVRTVAVLPFWNLSKDPQGAHRVRDVFSTSLLETNGVYVVPTGEVARAISRIGVASSVSPTPDEVVKLCAMLKADAVITGVLKEYGEVRTTSASANVVALSLQMQEASMGKVVWSGSSMKGGIGWAARLLGSAGGEPLEVETDAAVDDLLRQLFR